MEKGKTNSRLSIEHVRMKYETQLMGLPNVTGVGIGEKAGKAVIKVFVVRKVAADALRAGEIIPKRLEGYETDVEESGSLTVLSILL